MKLERAKEIIKTALSAPGAFPCVFFSGGADSLLVLALAREIKPDIDAVTFAADWTAEQTKQLEKIIGALDLTLYTFPPSNRYFVPNGQNLSVVDEYGFGELILPVVRDVEGGSDCVLEMSKERFSGFSLGWNTILTGTLESDYHDATGRTALAKDEIHEVGGYTFVQPLHDWTKAEVAGELAARDLTPIEKTGEVQRCAACLTGVGKVFCPAERRVVPAADWDKAGMLSAFRSKFGFNRSKLCQSEI